MSTPSAVVFGVSGEGACRQPFPTLRRSKWGGQSRDLTPLIGISNTRSAGMVAAHPSSTMQGFHHDRKR